jgi:phage-related protein
MEADGSIPLYVFLDKQPQKIKAKAIARLDLLEEKGYELRRPHADILRDEIYELRFRVVKVQYRFLYFFHGENVVVISHGIVKKGDEVPNEEINLAIERKRKFTKEPKKYSAD